jgi:hypothetical protein
LLAEEVTLAATYLAEEVILDAPEATLNAPEATMDDFHQICFATLHVVLGVHNSLLENLTQRLRYHENSCLSELLLLTEA